jgi:lysophospholipase L1-like esterase
MFCFAMQTFVLQDSTIAQDAAAETQPTEWKPGAGGVRQTTSEGDRTGILDPEYKPQLPTIFFIGDSTVKNSWGNGDGGLWGWADHIDPYFDLAKVNVENEALGGTSSRSYIAQGHWQRVLALVKPGDFVVMQFGHNDGAGTVDDPRNARRSINGSGDESQDVVIGDRTETVHTYGWYLKKIASDAKAKGATPVLCSLIPRNGWREGKINRSTTYAVWAKEAAESGDFLFVDLHKRICDQYDALGEEAVRATMFGRDATHPIFAGAALNAKIVVQGLKELPGDPFAELLSEMGDSLAAAPEFARP